MVERMAPIAVRSTTGPRAKLDQATVLPFEDGLLALARVGHPTVSWWHGYRRADDKFGSYCYVCESFIVRWGSNSSPPMEARATIDAHKHLHRSGDLPVTESTKRKGNKK